MPAVKLAVTADLHLPITPLAVIANLAKEVAVFDPAAFVIAGDVAESLADLHRCLEVLRAHVRCPILVLPGNHDLWHENHVSSLDKWQDHLPAMVQRTGCTWLEGNFFVEQGVAVAGSVAWYDYSAADPQVKATVQEFASKKGHYNIDAYMIDWPWTDLAFAEVVGNALVQTLDRLESNPEVRQVVVATHVPLLECQMFRDAANPDWAFSNAYFGNLTLGQRVVARSKVTHVISGHTHIGRHDYLQLPDGRLVEARVLDSHYGRPKWLALTLGF